MTGWLNWHLGRRRHFGRAEAILAAFATRLHADPPDAVVFSGDATVLAWEAEFARAAELLGAGGPRPLPGFAVPGNHDYYTRAAAASGHFERYFAAWQAGERVDGAAYPFARRVGHVWLVGVNSSTGNRWPSDARGAVGREQLARLERLLEHLDAGPRILVTHYPVARADGRPERRWHGLRDLADLQAVAARGRVGLWLHGHRHHPYALPEGGGAGMPVLCAGSLTQLGCASYWEYRIEGRAVRAVRHACAVGEGAFREEESLAFALG